ncbi:GldG family protein [Bacteriovoracaceae bacterium]|nr:GldG family protein [Bacteriovoracaceae bacterium]
MVGNKLTNLIELILMMLIILMFAASSVAWMVVPELIWQNIILNILFLITIGSLIYLKRAKIIPYIKGARFRNMMSALISAFLLFSILGVVNFLIFKGRVQIDVTNRGINSLSEETIKILKAIKDPVTARVFLRRKDQLTIIPLLDLYKLYKKDLDIKLIDPDLAPQLIKSYSISQYGSIVFTRETELKRVQKIVTVTSHSEFALTRGLLKFTRNSPVKIVFIYGHGEDDISVKSGKGLSTIRDKLINLGYQVKSLNLGSKPEIPPDTNVLVIWGPKVAFLPQEMAAVDHYLKMGGDLLLAINPDFNRFYLKEFVENLKNYGIKYSNDLVIDKVSHISGSKATIPLVSKYQKNHEITKNFKLQTFFPLSNSVVPYRVSKDILITRLITTSDYPNSWAEKDTEQIVSLRLKFDDGVDRPGPVPLALATEKTGISGTTKIVAFGTSSFVHNIYEKFSGNLNLFLNSVAWLTNEDFSINNNRMNVPDKGKLFLNMHQLNIILYFCLIVAPLILLFIAFIFYRRKNRK